MTPAITASAVTASATLLLGLVGFWRNARNSRIDRQRVAFAEALADCLQYREFPYVIRRRSSLDADGERKRIASELRDVQARLAHHTAWTTIESRRVGSYYSTLVQKTRAVAGGLMHEAWQEPAAHNDTAMNISGYAERLAELQPFDVAYVESVRDHLSLVPTAIRRLGGGFVQFQRR